MQLEWEGLSRRKVSLLVAGCSLYINTGPVDNNQLYCVTMHSGTSKKITPLQLSKHMGATESFFSSALLAIYRKALLINMVGDRLKSLMTSGKLVEFLVADGEKVEAGAPLYTLELDKSVQKVEAPASGTLKIIAAVGEVYAVGTLIAEIL